MPRYADLMIRVTVPLPASDASGQIAAMRALDALVNLFGSVCASAEVAELRSTPLPVANGG